MERMPGRWRRQGARRAAGALSAGAHTKARPQLRVLDRLLSCRMPPPSIPANVEPLGPHEVDLRVGENLRRLRKGRRWSQGLLAERVGLTFQQVQKYERGTNRISASRLYQFANVMGVPLGEFFAGLADGEKGAQPAATVPDELLVLIGSLPTPQRRLLLKIATELVEGAEGL